MRYVFALYGPTRSGKSRLIADMASRQSDRLAVVRSVTTRPYRGPEDDANYSHHLSDDEFEEWCRDGRIVQHVDYGARKYGTAKAELMDVLNAHNGICAMTEDGIRNLAAAGFRVVPVQVIPLHQENDDLTARENAAARRADDMERATRRLQPLIVVINDFHDGKFESVAQTLERDLCSFMNGLPDPR